MQTLLPGQVNVQGCALDDSTLERFRVDVDETHFLNRFQLELGGPTEIAVSLGADVGKPRIARHRHAHRIAGRFANRRR